MAERYVLATGEEAAVRLRILNGVHGPDTSAFLTRAGLKPGLRVADIGCGSGIVACQIAQRVGEHGEVVGVDRSPDQVAQAQRTARAAGVTNARFMTADGYATGLERESFDFVFSRFMLMHLQAPQKAIMEMRALLKPGGILAVEDGDFTTPFCYPKSPAFEQLFTWYRQAGERHGEDFLIGQKLYGMVCEAGFAKPEVALAQPVFVRGDEKRLPEWTLSETAPALEESDIATRAQVEAVVEELARLAEDDRVMFGMARMTQVWARK